MLRYAPLGDHAIVITLGESIDEATHRRVRAVSARLDETHIPGLVDQVPAFASVVAHYDPGAVSGDPARSPYERILGTIQAALADLAHAHLPAPRLVEIPVCYGGDLGPDLEDVASRHGLAARDVVAIHTSGDYLVYMVGFMPGFAYLGGLDPRIATPRRQSPRTAVPAGTVGIGGEQTGVYPVVSPGGWNLIGRTPLRVFDKNREDAALLATGDRVRFRAITAEEYQEWRA